MPVVCIWEFYRIIYYYFRYIVALHFDEYATLWVSNFEMYLTAGAMIESAAISPIVILLEVTYFKWFIVDF